MVANSQVNPNFPIPGIDQSSKGFRDNFSSIKNEIESLQGKNIVLTGDVTAGPVLIDSGTADVIIECVVGVANVAAGGSNLNVQYNNTGVIAGAANFIYVPTSGYVGMGTASPQVQLDVSGAIHGRNEFALTGPTSNLLINNLNSEIQFSSETSAPIVFQINSSNIVNVSSNGVSIGVGTSAPISITPLKIVSNSSIDTADFNNLVNNADSGVRITNNQPNSTAALILEQTYGNSVGGLRIDAGGNITLHSGEFAGSQLSSNSTRMTINASGKIGIGSTVPQFALDVNGSVQSNNSYISNPAPISISASTTTVIDQWNITLYRTASYTIQATDTVAGNIDISKVLVTYANGGILQYVYTNLNSAGSLGTIGNQLNNDMVQLTYNTSNSGIIVKVDANYITV